MGLRPFCFLIAWRIGIQCQTTTGDAVWPQQQGIPTLLQGISITRRRV